MDQKKKNWQGGGGAGEEKVFKAWCFPFKLIYYYLFIYFYSVIENHQFFIIIIII